jgi:NAD(P)-dependent dehydrogenase (short-subunit alcohol dehydrogenase family)
MDLSLSSKLVLVTGSASGIGKAAAERFLREGATVVINGLFDAEVDAALKHLQAFGTVSGCVADLSTSEGAERLHAFARAIGPIDILVNNVGVFSVQPFVEASDEDWQRYFNINVMSAIRMARLALPDMLERNSGSIVNLSSEAAVKPLPQMVHYSVTKTALLGLTRGLAEICKGTGVRVNSVLPGANLDGRRRLLFRRPGRAKGQADG